MTKFLNISTDNTLGGSSASDDVVSSQKAVKDYVDNHSGGGAVNSVNGKTGTVVLDYSDVGALPDTTVIPTVDQTYSSTSSNAQSGTAVASAVSGKQDTITGGATTITSRNLTTNRALVSNSSGKVDVSSVTSTELGYVSGVTSAIQTQLNGKADINLNNVSSNIEELTEAISSVSKSSLHIAENMTSINCKKDDIVEYLEKNKDKSQHLLGMVNKFKTE